MQKNHWLWGGLVVIVVAFGLYYFVVGMAPTPQSNGVASAPSPQAKRPVISAPTAPVATATPNPSIATTVVMYNDSGFGPATITVKSGTAVSFENKGSQPVWPASDPHPIHTLYPTTGGCVSSTFDACRGLAPGESWTFTFDKVGTWGYHNHLNPSQKGTVIVQ